jgi:hypothetical protein
VRGGIMNWKEIVLLLLLFEIAFLRFLPFTSIVSFVSSQQEGDVFESMKSYTVMADNM